jgi:hypothetical protein
MAKQMHVVTVDTDPQRKFVIFGDDPEERLKELYPALTSFSCHSTRNLSHVEMFGEYEAHHTETAP